MSNSKMKITILGSGTCVPSLTRSSSSILIEIDNYKLLFDIGAGTIRQLLHTNTKISEITHIFLTHFHPDHIGEIISFLFSSRYSGLIRKSPLTIIGGNGFINLYNQLKNIFGHLIELDSNMLNLIEMSEKMDNYSCNLFEIKTANVNHNPESIAYKITNLIDSKSIVYSGDTDYCDNLIFLAKNCDLLICESSFPDNHKVNGHLTPGLAGEIAEKSFSKKLILTHLYPECEKTDILEECKKKYNGDVVVAKDLICISL